MLKKGYKIDNDGFYIEDFIYKEGKNLDENIITIDINESFYKPRWDGRRWTEGATQEYIDSMIVNSENENLIDKLILDNINMQMQIDSLIQTSLGGN